MEQRMETGRVALLGYTPVDFHRETPKTLGCPDDTHTDNIQDSRQGTEVHYNHLFATVRLCSRLVGCYRHTAGSK